MLRDDRRTARSERRARPRATPPPSVSGTFRRPICCWASSTPIGASALVDSHFAELPSLIPPGDLLVLNTTKVRHARLLGTPPLRRAGRSPADPSRARTAPGSPWASRAARSSPASGSSWAPAPGSRRWRCCPTATAWSAFIGAIAEEAIARYGRLPLPPYITRDPTELDEARYQTVYARDEGSVAAPTAGLHFTPALLDALSAKGVLVAGLDLQVGPGTFKPVEVEDPAEHTMHPERYEIRPRLAALVERVREQGGRRLGGGHDRRAGAGERRRDDGAVHAGARRDQPDDHPGL